ncbi:MAG: CBS domain-containing protein [Kiloniellales bacterium]
MQRKIVPDLVSNQSLASLPPGASVRDAAKVMTERHIGAILIAVDGRLQGVFTERDVLTRVVMPGLDPDETALGGVMTPNPDTVGPDDTAHEALRRMSERGYRHLPVVKDGRLIGIVSIRDLYAAVNSQLAEDLQQRDAFMFDTGYGSG